MIISFDDKDLDSLSYYLKDRVSKIVSEIRYVSRDNTLYDESELAIFLLDDDEIILEWINGWKRVQFILCEDEDYEEVVFIDNRNKESVPNFHYRELDMTRLSEIVSEAANLIQSPVKTDIGGYDGRQE